MKVVSKAKHTDVNCIDQVSHSVSCVADASGLVALYDHRVFTKALLEARVPGEITALKKHPIKEHDVYFAAGSGIYLWDIRMSSSSKEHDTSVAEISAFDIGTRGNIAIGNDDGKISCGSFNETKEEGLRELLRLPSSTYAKDMKRHHEMMVTGVCFRQKQPYEFVSIGFDRSIHVYDIMKGRLVDMVTLNDEEQTMTMVNPPYFYCMHLFNDTKMSVGCGDGSVLVLKKKNDKKVSKWTRFSLNGHNSAVVSVQIANDLLYSCSNTGELFTWNLKSNAQMPCDKLKFSSKLNAVRTITSCSSDSAPCNLLLATTNSIFFLQQQL